MPRTFEYVTLYDKRDFADVIKLKILTWKDYPGLPASSQCNDKGSYERDTGGSESEAVIDNKAEDGVMHFEDWRKGSQVKEYGWPLEGGKGK